MKLPFTLEQFLDVFRQYNNAVWPMQVILIFLALAAVYFSIRKNIYSNKIIVAILAFFWLWMGVTYHLLFFSSINKAAIVFGGSFILQSILFVYLGLVKRKLAFGFNSGISGITGIILILSALLIYPLIGHRLGHIYPSSPTFGLPCPTTIFTFGILLFSVARIPLVIVVIPFLWALIGFSAAFSLGIIEDTGLLIANLLFIILVIYKNRKLNSKYSI